MTVPAPTAIARIRTNEARSFMAGILPAHVQLRQLRRDTISVPPTHRSMRAFTHRGPVELADACTSTSLPGVNPPQDERTIRFSRMYSVSNLTGILRSITLRQPWRRGHMDCDGSGKVHRAYHR